ncbi:hypothetical protein A3F00_03050 [Candidatus Daviesbacteria bacterium RIFCSPHIGHO2_12_FULL_37_11]|uniref:DUF6879 domain-containing protein n=1 Tax=Candidatus Daviesbacteria bacterium RIFCSPHIGHO2_12_FULL_37_11 TaxID=1797777 RepID=A0A1F5KBG6_9BACT|nr:MAG: hypothetical protein A2769_04340 [Candidatus Daviesbacteria bacterium RIFCSPHIGHO2_01_FULL_37_27]OGE38276.1 MAG: hypothetical protein A3F00_03050 [Candidatus Daviesbacteria bacterium RIFCSPHIGHO2_12_FULL_37_11]OGE46232.1 MAG: hypothetical protein A3B39_02815 [Candidatus Daviesbacteria bacterium RIFCSPLOWO2_01_FULL_37_10]
MKQFKKAWDQSRKSIFRLELLSIYNVSGDRECFQKFLKHEDYIDNEFREWLIKIENTNKKGVRTERVRIYAQPVNDYIKYEIDAWKHSIKVGDKVFFLDYEKYVGIIEELKIVPEDFWLFDESVLVTFHYGSDGSFIGEELMVGDVLIRKCIDLKNKLLDISIPYQQFLKDI